MRKIIALTVVLAGGAAAYCLIPPGYFADPPQSNFVRGPLTSAEQELLADGSESFARPLVREPIKKMPPSAPVVVNLSGSELVMKPMALSPAAAVPADRGALARELQSELKRVGCFGGEINGVWTPATRKAMQAFNRRVNATLPTDEPDQILLALVRRHHGIACGAACPPGQDLSAEGRCVPSAILAKATSKREEQAEHGKTAAEPNAAITSWPTKTTAASPPPPREGLMALSGSGQIPPAAAEPGTGAAKPQTPPQPARAAAAAKQFGPQIFKQFDKYGSN